MKRMLVDPTLHYEGERGALIFTALVLERLGVGSAAIAAAVGVTQSTVQNWLREEKLEDHLRDLSDVLPKRPMEMAGPNWWDDSLGVRLRKPTAQTVTAHIKAVEDAHGISLSVLRGRSRRADIARARHELMYRMRNAGMSLKEVGSFLGGRDHSTVIHGVRKIQQEIDRAKGRGHGKD